MYVTIILTWTLTMDKDMKTYSFWYSGHSSGHCGLAYTPKYTISIVVIYTYYTCFVVQSLSPVWLFAIPWTAAWQASLSFTISQSLLKLMSIESVIPSDHLILCHPFLLLPSIFPSIRVFSRELAVCISWPKYWSISPSNEYSGLISFRIDWFDLLAVQGTL